MFDPSSTTVTQRVHRSVAPALLAILMGLGFPASTVRTSNDVESPAERAATQRDVLRTNAPSVQRTVAPPPPPPPPEDEPHAPSSPLENIADTTAPAESTAPTPELDPFGPITSPDVGEHCSQGLSAAELTDFFSEPIGAFQGADYQRALRLADDRVLWTFQDAFIAGTLVHNVGVVQSGRCFTMLNDGARSWLLAEATIHMSRWHWILDGGQAEDGTIHLFVAEMNEQGSGYLSRTEPTQLRRVVVDGATLEPIDVIDEQPTGTDLFGWAVTSDSRHTYLYSHCYRQFGFSWPFGFDECAADVKLARVPVGLFDAPREYWDGRGWARDPADARPVVDSSFLQNANNPAQIRFDGERYLLVEKRDDWWGLTVEFAVAETPWGPFRRIVSVEQPLKCDPTACNTYFAAWIPWVDSSGAHIWSIGHNRWNGAETAGHLGVYRPTFHTVFL